MARKPRWLGPVAIALGIVIGLSVRQCAGCGEDDAGQDVGDAGAAGASVSTPRPTAASPSAAEVKDGAAGAASKAADLGTRPSLKVAKFVPLVKRQGESLRVFSAIRSHLVEQMGEEQGMQALQILEDDCGEVYAVASAGLKTKGDTEVLIDVLATSASDMFSIASERGEEWQPLTELFGAYVYSCLYDIEAMRKPLHDKLRPKVEDQLGIDLDAPSGDEP